MKKRFWFKLGDILVIIGVLLLAAYLIAPRGAGGGRHKNLVVRSGTQSINLQWDSGLIDLEKLTGKKMIVEALDGKARVLSSNCPDKVCMLTGWISECGQVAACLPNGVALLVECE